MSDENVEIMRAAYEAWAEGGVEAVLPLVDEAFELRPPPGWPGLGPFRGHEGLRAAFRESRDVFADVRMRPERFIDLDGQVLVLGKVLVRSKGAEVEMEGTLSHLWTMREGKATMLQIYGDPQRALEAAGLREYAMSQENVKLVRSIFAAWERADLHYVDWADPEIEFVIADGPSPDSAKGLAGMSAAMREFLGAWQEWRVEADEYRALDDERVLVLQHFIARGKTSGAELGGLWANGANLFHIRDGKVTRLVCYFDRERALEAVGLRE